MGYRRRQRPPQRPQPDTTPSRSSSQRTRSRRSTDTIVRIFQDPLTSRPIQPSQFPLPPRNIPARLSPPGAATATAPATTDPAPLRYRRPSPPPPVPPLVPRVRPPAPRRVPSPRRAPSPAMRAVTTPDDDSIALLAPAPLRPAAAASRYARTAARRSAPRPESPVEGFYAPWVRDMMARGLREV